MSEEVKKRQLPAYLEYASDVLANLNYRLMSLSERGLWDTMRKECWVNERVPAEPIKLAKILNLSPEEVTRNLTPQVIAFFELNGTFYQCPELNNYKLGTLSRREKMSKGGAKGGQKTQYAIREAKATPEGGLKGLNREDEIRGDEKRMSPSAEIKNEHQEWIDEYEAK